TVFPSSRSTVSRFRSATRSSRFIRCTNYKMHKWFARRASCVFRAILLGALKPLPTDGKGNPIKSGAQLIMDEFYKDHTNDPDTKGKVILDPFMGGGTTVVEALRLGCKVIGI